MNLKDKLYDLVERNTKWTRLRKIQGNKIVKSSYIWLVIVPTYSKLAISLHNNLNIDISLPFSWQLFFFAALVFVIANIVYLYYCPPIIKEFFGWDDFLRSGRDVDYLLENYPECDEEIGEERAFIQHLRYTNARTPTSEESLRDMRRYFLTCYDNANTLKEKARKLCAGIYLFAFFLFFCVIVSNIYWVVYRISQQ